MSLWYIGDPCYAIEDDRWSEFCDMIGRFKSEALEGSGIEFKWYWIDEEGDERVHRVRVYNSGLGGDGSFELHGYKFSVDAGLLSVLPIEICGELSNEEKTVGAHGGYAIVDARFRPVWEINTDHFPHISLDINGTIQTVTDGYEECDACGEMTYENNMVYNDHQGAVCCGCEEE